MKLQIVIDTDTLNPDQHAALTTLLAPHAKPAPTKPDQPPPPLILELSKAERAKQKAKDNQ